MKAKKILAAVLAVAMILSSMSLSVFADETVEIATAEQLKAFAAEVNGGNNYKGKTVTLTADIDLENVSWTPIGNNSNVFAGIFDGRNHTISNLKIEVDEASDSGTGFFGSVNGGTVKNLVIDGADVKRTNTADATVGGTAIVVGTTAYGGTIQNVSVKNATVECNRYGAGIVGYAKGEISNCTVENIEIKATPNATASGYDNGDKIGGIVGYCNSGATTISGCKVIGTNKLTAYRDIGGIVGRTTDKDTVVANNEVSGNLAMVADQKTGYYADKATNVGVVVGSNAKEAQVSDNTSADVETTVTFIDKNGKTASGVAEVNGAIYSSLKDALAAVEAMTGDVTVTLIGDAEWETGAGHGSTPLVSEGSTVGNVTIAGNGNTITATGAGVGSLRAANGTLLTFNDVNFVDESESYAEDAWEFTYLEFGGKLKFEGCSFASGIQVDADNDTAPVTVAEFIDCEFNSPNSSEYSVWLGNGSASFKDCTFTGTRALKIHEDYGTDVDAVTVDGCTFANISEKPAVVIGDLNADTALTIKNCKVNAQAGDQEKYIYETDTDVTTFDFVLDNNDVVSANFANYGAYDVKTRGTPGTDDYRERFGVDVYNISVFESLQVKIYSGDNLLCTTSLRKTDRDDATNVLIPVSGATTVNVVVKGKLAGSWDTEWHIAPNVAYMPDYVELYADGILVDTYTGGFNDADAAAYKALTGVAAAAKIGDTKYATLADALKAAADGDVIEVADGTHKLDSISNKAVTIKGGKNAVIDCTKTTTMSGADITFDGVTIKGANANYIGLHHANTETYKNCTIEGQIWTYGTALFENCTFNQTSSDLYNIWTYGAKTATFKNCKFYSAGTSVLVYKEEGTVRYAANFEDCEFYASQAVEGKAAIEINSSLNPYDVVINNCSAVGFDEGSVSGDMLWNLKLGDETSCTITIDGKTVTAASADTIYVQFEKTEDENVYDIILVGKDDVIINRLTSADLEFAFTSIPATNAVMSYDIAPATFVTLSKTATDRYMFNFDGVNKPDDTGNKLKIGEVTFGGYGKFTFGINAASTAENVNIVNATKIANNIVNTFVIGGDINKGQGALVVNENLTSGNDMVGKIDSEIKVPVSKLTINVTFPNIVEDNNADYQNMKVEISGGDLEAPITERLSNFNNTLFDGYTIIKDLTTNLSYNVTVSGAGYRTARYTVSMTDDKVLNFWNNVMDNALEVEEGKADSAKNVTFLAGDIVADNHINIYDLSAVVSYFGEIDLTESEDKYEYAKYDLNRDGKIDSKDVALVLVSWNN